MYFAIILMIAITVAVAVIRLGPTMAKGATVYDVVPDRPAGFGYRMGWLAVRTRDTAAVVQALGLADVVAANWNSGIGSVYDDKLGENHVFVSPPVNGWTFVVGLSLPFPAKRGFVDKCSPLLLGLGERFVEVQFFYAYPPVDYFGWARIIDRKLVRMFAVTDEGTVVNRGRVSPEERALGLKAFELRGVRGRRGDAGGELILHPTEDHVMRLAQKWSLDPVKIDAVEAEAGIGWIGLAPAYWRPERLRQTA